MTIVLNGTTGITNDGGYTGDGIVFADTTPANTLVTDTSGNVGIGTNSPTAKLHVSGTSKFTGDLSQAVDTSVLSIYGGSAYNTGAGVLLNGASHPTDANLIRFTRGAFVESARIDSSGNLLVGTTTARGKITSTGSFSDGSTWSSTAAINVNGAFGGAVSFVDGAAGYAVYCADSGNDFYIRGAPNLSSSLTGGVYINDRATSWSSASDERLKTIIEPITDAVNKVCQLRAVIGRYNHEAEEKRHPFLIAQDVQAVLPEAVSVADKQSEEQYLGVSYTDTIPLLVAAIKEQQAIITALTARVTALEGA